MCIYADTNMQSRHVLRLRRLSSSPGMGNQAFRNALIGWGSSARASKALNFTKIHVHVYARISTYMDMCVYVFICVYTYVYIYVCICVHI